MPFQRSQAQSKRSWHEICGNVQFIIFKGNLLRLRISMWCQSTTTPQSKPLIYNDFQQKCDFWFTPRLPTSPISSSVITISALKTTNNTIQVRDFTQPDHLISPLIPSIPIPINAQQPSTTKILDKRTTWILVNNTIQTCYDRKPTSWPPIKITYSQPTNLDPLPIESNIEQTWQPKMTQTHVPPVNHTHHPARVDQTNKPSPRHESPCFEHHRA